MNRRGALVRLLALFPALLLTGCLSSTRIAYVPAGPPEKHCTLKVIATLTVKRIDQETVHWTSDLFDSWAEVRIPEGSHRFVLDYNRWVNEERHYREGIVVSHGGFVAGHTYEMVAAEGMEGGFADFRQAMLASAQRALRIGIKDVTPGAGGMIQWLPWEQSATTLPATP